MYAMRPLLPSFLVISSASAAFINRAVSFSMLSGVSADAGDAMV